MRLNPQTDTRFLNSSWAATSPKQALHDLQIHIDNIHKKTGKTPDDFRKLAEKKGLLKPGVKAMEVVNWLKKEHGLGHGHAMAIHATFKGRTK
jgi:Domain of unknown function (DUF4287)